MTHSSPDLSKVRVAPGLVEIVVRILSKYGSSTTCSSSSPKSNTKGAEIVAKVIVARSLERGVGHCFFLP